MNWLARLISGRSEPGALDGAVRQSIREWKELPEVDLGRPHFETRYTVVNTEASGLNLDHDTLLSVGAIVVDEGLIVPAESYYAELAPDPAVTLANLLSFAGKGPLVVFSAAFNRTMLERAFETHLGFTPDLTWIDLYVLLPAVFGERIDHGARLADWMGSFDIETFQRHHALGDAWVIAQLLLAVQARSIAMGAGSPRALAEIERSRRQLNRA